MAISTVVKHLHDGSITLSDGTGSPVTLVVPFSTGDLSTDGEQETQNAVNAYETRGVLHTVRHGAKSYISGSFSFMVPEYTNSSIGVAIDFLKQQNAYSGNNSTLVPTEVYAVDIILTTEGTDLGDGKDHTTTLTDCVCTIARAEGEPNTASISFTCYGTMTDT